MNPWVVALNDHAPRVQTANAFMGMLRRPAMSHCPTADRADLSRPWFDHRWRSRAHRGCASTSAFSPFASDNHFYLFRDVMSVCLDKKDWDEVERYATEMEKFTDAEPLSWCDFFIKSGRH